MRFALLDHRDSFTLNVRDWLEFGPSRAAVAVVAADDQAAVLEVLRAGLPLVLSPGPKRPEDAPISLAAIRSAIGRVPVLGICLGHQQLAHVCGAKIVPAKAPFHGTTRAVKILDAAGLFAGVTSGFCAAMYNSLTVDVSSIRHPWRVTALCEQGEVAGIARHVDGEAPAFGLQFHPESFLSESGGALRANWLRIVEEWQASQSHASATAPLSIPS